MKENLREVLNNLIKSITHDTNWLIAKEIIKELDFGRKPNINTISEKTYTNKSTVTRFSKSLGFEGFRQFVEILMIQESKYYGSDLKLPSTSNSFNYTRDSFLKLINEMDVNYNFIEIISNDIIKYRKVNIFSSIQNGQVASNFNQQLQQIGIISNHVEYNLQQNLSSVVCGDYINLFIVSGVSNDLLSKIYENLFNEGKICYLISSTSQLSKFEIKNNLINIKVGKSMMRENFKTFCFRYILDQIFSLILNSDVEFRNIITDPKFKY